MEEVATVVSQFWSPRVLEDNVSQCWTIGEFNDSPPGSVLGMKEYNLQPFMGVDLCRCDACFHSFGWVAYEDEKIKKWNEYTTSQELKRKARVLPVTQGFVQKIVELRIAIYQWIKGNPPMPNITDAWGMTKEQLDNHPNLTKPGDMKKEVVTDEQKLALWAKVEKVFQEAGLPEGYMVKIELDMMDECETYCPNPDMPQHRELHPILKPENRWLVMLTKEKTRAMFRWNGGIPKDIKSRERKLLRQKIKEARNERQKKS